MKFSVIVPVYNAEKYLEDCLNSLKKQEFQDCEFIIWNDGSTDGSEGIINKYCVDTRFRVFHGQNAGSLVARKNSLQRAQGKYVLFLDADDIVSDNLLNYIDKEIDERTDLFQYASSLSIKDLCKTSHLPSTKYNRIDFIEKYVRPVLIDGTVGVVMWNKVFLREKLLQVIGDYPTGMLEDYLTVLEYSEFVYQFQTTNTILHYYRVVEGSLSKRYNSEWFDILLYVQNRKKEYMKRMELNEKEDIQHAAAWFLRYVLNKLLKGIKYMETVDCKKILSSNEVRRQAALLERSKMDTYFERLIRRCKYDELLRIIRVEASLLNVLRKIKKVFVDIKGKR